MSRHRAPSAARFRDDSRSEDVLAMVLARAESDVGFRRELLAEPHRAIEEVFGVQVPRDFRLRFIERGPDVDALVVLPDLRASDDELSPETLEHVAGGAHTQNAHLAWKGTLAPRTLRAD